MEMVEFLSPEWLRLFRSFVQQGLTDDDIKGIEFSLCEVYKDVPAHLRTGPSAEVCFGFRIRNGKLEFLNQPANDATISVVADYESMAPWVSLPLAQSRSINLLERLTSAGKLRVRGNVRERSPIMEKLNLHDRLAEWTKPYVATPKWESSRSE